MAQPILDRHPRLSSALRGLTNSWVNSARNHAPVVARAAASVAVAHSVRTLASVEALFNASDHNGLFFNASDHHGMFFSWENFAEFEGTSITQEITEELPDDVHSGALYAVLGLSLVVLFGDVAFGYKCRETKMKRAANFSELSERLSELDAKLAQEEVAAATPVSLARSLSEQRLEHAKGKAMAVLLRDADQQAAATVPPRTREPEPQSPEEMAAEWHDFKRTKLRFLVLTCVLGFASELLLWMLAPFLPLVAKNKGVSPELVGVLFACHPIALGISSHLAPWLMRNIEPFVLLQRTLFLQAIFISGFGLAGGIESTVPFICCAAINRFMLGLMSGINEPTSQAITLRVVPTHAIGFAFGMIISSRFTAMLIGPALGGALYTAGGFPLPFMVSGCIYLFLGCLTMYVGISTPGDVSPPPGDVTVWTLVRVRGMPWMLGCIFLLWLNTMALEPLYQPQLARAPYKLSVLNVGLVLSSATGALVLTMSLSGHLSRMVDAYSQQTVGFVLLITALPFLGPEPGFHLDANVSLFVGAVSSSPMRPTRRRSPPLRLRLRLPAPALPRPTRRRCPPLRLPRPTPLPTRPPSSSRSTEHPRPLPPLSLPFFPLCPPCVRVPIPPRPLSSRAARCMLRGGWPHRTDPVSALPASALRCRLRAARCRVGALLRQRHLCHARVALRAAPLGRLGAGRARLRELHQVAGHRHGRTLRAPAVLPAALPAERQGHAVRGLLEPLQRSLVPVLPGRGHRARGPGGARGRAL